MIPRRTLDTSAAYAHCEAVVRRSGSSFAAAFWLLPKPKRRAVHAIYAFCRMADDIGDEPGIALDRAQLLDRWKSELEAAYRNKAVHPVGVALADCVQRYRLPEDLFVELLLGVESDLSGARFDTFEDLRRYCHRVASTVGLLLVRVIGYRNPGSLAYAENMGIAVQLTNVLRDIGADAAMGRIYLPSEDLDRLDVSPADLERREMSDPVRLLLGFYAERARLFYDRADALLPAEDRRALLPAAAMGRIYRVLLDELQRRGFPCLETSLRLSQARRVAIAASVCASGWMGRPA